MINIGYGFQGVGRKLGDFPFLSDALTNESARPVSAGMSREGERVIRYQLASGNRFARTPLGSLRVPLPEEYLLGMDAERRDFETPPLPSYLRGSLSKAGWWYFYPYALGVKAPLGTICIALMAFTLAGAGRAFRAPLRFELALLCAPVALIVAASIERSVAQSVRYVLPAFPFVFIAMGRVGVLFEPSGETLPEAPKGNRRMRARLILRAFIGACLAANAVSVLSVCPHFLAYFNEVAGGPSNGPRHLLFSNLDWGQDLLFLKDWIAEHPKARPLGLAYFHFVDPALESIEFELPPRAPAPG
ncbi:MAG: hypothetical protein ACREJM_03330, partial [Candidatus Saccharimonadales bacterium]